jgi:hypothetical protein
VGLTDGGFMKALANVVVVLLLAIASFGITRREVKFVRSYSNAHGVKFVEVATFDGQHGYTLGCNDGEEDCVTPDYDVSLDLMDTPSDGRKYTNRENVLLCPPKNGVCWKYWVEASY